MEFKTFISLIFIRVSYAQDADTVQRGVNIIAQEVARAYQD